MTRLRIATAALAAAVFLGGCATVPAPGADVAAPAPVMRAPSKADPWENFNRKVYAFNDAIDAAVLKPVAEAYKAVVPQLVRQGFDNVISNVGDIWSAANEFLQGKGQKGLQMIMRVGSNTVIGLGGLLDPATEMGLERHKEDFGQTLGRWGVPPGPYLVLPFLGPRTVRDAAAYPLDRVTGFAYLAGDGASAYAMTALELIHYRAGLLSTGSLLSQIALDKYSFVRDSYLAKRRNDVYDGNPPLNDDDDPYEEPGSK